MTAWLRQPSIRAITDRWLHDPSDNCLDFHRNRSTKGVFITTSKFTRDAIDYARSLANVTIVLIDGMQLAEYMYQYGLGVEIRDEFAIKDLDESYWDELADGAPSLPAQA